jgi:hypothetical protein
LVEEERWRNVIYTYIYIYIHIYICIYMYVCMCVCSFLHSFLPAYLPSYLTFFPLQDEGRKGGMEHDKCWWTDGRTDGRKERKEKRERKEGKDGTGPSIHLRSNSAEKTHSNGTCIVFGDDYTYIYTYIHTYI